MSGVDGKFIQTIATKRFINSGEDLHFDGHIVPEVNFNCFRKQKPGMYLEFFMEGQNSLSGKPDDNGTSIVWNSPTEVFSEMEFSEKYLYK